LNWRVFDNWLRSLWPIFFFAIFFFRFRFSKKNQFFSLLCCFFLNMTSVVENEEALLRTKLDRLNELRVQMSQTQQLLNTLETDVATLQKKKTLKKSSSRPRRFLGLIRHTSSAQNEHHHHHSLLGSHHGGDNSDAISSIRALRFDKAVEQQFSRRRKIIHENAEQAFRSIAEAQQKDEAKKSSGKKIANNSNSGGGDGQKSKRKRSTSSSSRRRRGGGKGKTKSGQASKNRDGDDVDGDKSWDDDDGDDEEDSSEFSGPLSERRGGVNGEDDFDESEFSELSEDEEEAAAIGDGDDKIAGASRVRLEQLRTERMKMTRSSVRLNAVESEEQLKQLGESERLNLYGNPYSRISASAAAKKRRRKKRRSPGGSRTSSPAAAAAAAASRRVTSPDALEGTQLRNDVGADVPKNSLSRTGGFRDSMRELKRQDTGATVDQLLALASSDDGDQAVAAAADDKPGLKPPPSLITPPPSLATPTVSPKSSPKVSPRVPAVSAAATVAPVTSGYEPPVPLADAKTTAAPSLKASKRSKSSRRLQSKKKSSRKLLSSGRSKRSLKEDTIISAPRPASGYESPTPVPVSGGYQPPPSNKAGDGSAYEAPPSSVGGDSDSELPSMSTQSSMSGSESGSDGDEWEIDVDAFNLDRDTQKRGIVYSSDSDEEEDGSGGGGKKSSSTRSSAASNWNERFQVALRALRQQNMHSQVQDKIAGNQRLLDLSSDFLYAAKTYGKIIISEVYVKPRKKTIPPATLGGQAGGDKVCLKERERKRNARELE
jgi:Clustered mitochondria